MLPRGRSPARWRSSGQVADRSRAVVVCLSGRDLGLYRTPAPLSMLVLRAEGDLREGVSPGGLPAFWMAAMDVDKGMNARRERRHLVTVPVRRGWTFHLPCLSRLRLSPSLGRPSCIRAGFPEAPALPQGAGSLIPAGRRASGWVIEIAPRRELLTCAVGVALRGMSNPATSLARAPTSQGGPR
jgi:hypothetical protein